MLLKQPHRTFSMNVGVSWTRLLFLKTESHTVQAGLKLTVSPDFELLRLLHTLPKHWDHRCIPLNPVLYGVKRLTPGLCACWVNTLPTEVHLQLPGEYLISVWFIFTGTTCVLQMLEYLFLLVWETFDIEIFLSPSFQFRMLLWVYQFPLSSVCIACCFHFLVPSCFTVIYSACPVLWAVCVYFLLRTISLFFFHHPLISWTSPVYFSVCLYLIYLLTTSVSFMNVALSEKLCW